MAFYLHFMSFVTECCSMNYSISIPHGISKMFTPMWFFVYKNRTHWLETSAERVKYSFLLFHHHHWHSLPPPEFVLHILPPSQHYDRWTAGAAGAAVQCADIQLVIASLFHVSPAENLPESPASHDPQSCGTHKRTRTHTAYTNNLPTM